jgi:hypothetical protein
MTAVLKVKLQSSLEFRLDVTVNVVGDLAPYFHTADFYNCGFHGFESLVTKVTTV